MVFNVELATEALDYAEQSPELWLDGSDKWAIEREDGLTVTSLAGHVAIISGVDFWYEEGEKHTNWVELRTVPDRFHAEIADYIRDRKLDWPEGTCSIFLAARLLLDLDQDSALDLMAHEGSIDEMRVKVKNLADRLS